MGEERKCGISLTRPRQRTRVVTGFGDIKLGPVSVFGLVLNTLLLLAPSVSGARESSKGYDADLTLFSPEGRLYQVEYVMRAVGQYGCPTVGVHGDGCCVVACRRDLPDELVYPESISNIFRITDDIYSACTGMPGDVRYQVKRTRLQALEYRRQYGSPMPSRLLALTMADAAQVNTQHAAMRPMACVSLTISVDDLAGPLLFRVEPSGQYYQAWGTAAGRGSASSIEFLEKMLEEARDEQRSAVENIDREGTGDTERGSCDVDTNASDGPGEEDNEELVVKERRRRSETGFGVVGEDETVGLALQALSKASFGKERELKLTEANVEIAIASAATGVRVCSRAEVKGFLGKLACAGR